MTPKEIVYTTDPNLVKLYNAVVEKQEDKITINICWLKCLYIEDICWSNVIFAYKCLNFDAKWAKQTNWLVDSMLLTVTCTKDDVEIKPHIMNIVKPRISRRPNSQYMIQEVSKLYTQLKRLQKTLAERESVFVTSWGIPLNETELTEILNLIERNSK